MRLDGWKCNRDLFSSFFLPLKRMNKKCAVISEHRRDDHYDNPNNANGPNNTPDNTRPKVGEVHRSVRYAILRIVYAPKTIKSCVAYLRRVSDLSGFRKMRISFCPQALAFIEKTQFQLTVCRDGHSL